MRTDFIPLIFAGDINVYSVARAFHEEYGIKSYAYGKFYTGPCARSKIIHYTANPKADEQDVFLELVHGFAALHPNQQVLLIGCGDNYVQLISKNMDKFPENVIAPVIGIDMMNDLIHKEKFYDLCERMNIDYPSTFVHRQEMGENFQLPFEAPFIVKPSNGVAYWKHPFPTQKKVYKADTRKELEEILKDIYGAGYEDSIIIQDFIPGDDTYMRVLTSYSDKHGAVKMMCLGHVLLEEHTPHGIGNHAVIITESNSDLEQQMKGLLEELCYVGFSNFDIKYDQRDDRYKVFEINTRQGRSNYYVTGAGENVARYLVTDYVDQKEIPFTSVKQESLWMVVPKKVAFDYVCQDEYRKRMKQLIRTGHFVNPLFYAADAGFLRRLRLWKSQLSHFVKYKKYLKK